MIFSVSEPPRTCDDQGLKITHKIVVDDHDIAIMPTHEIESYFPAVRPGFQRASITQGHNDTDQQTLFLVIDQEIGASHGG